MLNGNGFRLENTALNFDIILVNGHTEKQMLPLLKYKNKTVVFAADLIPTAGHLPVSYVMGYDTRPLLSLKEKNRFLKLACKEDFLLFLEHDPYNELINLQLTDRGIRLNEKHTLSSFFK